jgi:hypothetical protein
MVTSSEKAALSMQSWVGTAVGVWRDDVSTGVGDEAAESTAGSVGVGLGESAGNSTEVGVGGTGVAAAGAAASEEVPQAARAREQNANKIVAFMVVLG